MFAILFCETLDCFNASRDFKKSFKRTKLPTSVQHKQLVGKLHFIKNVRHKKLKKTKKLLSRQQQEKKTWENAT